jgi:hypothetical protein
MEAARPEGNEGTPKAPEALPVARRIGLAEDPKLRAGSAAIPDHRVGSATYSVVITLAEPKF